jgi:hypothetical protein
MRRWPQLRFRNHFVTQKGIRPHQRRMSRRDHEGRSFSKRRGLE